MLRKRRAEPLKCGCGYCWGWSGFRRFQRNRRADLPVGAIDFHCHSAPDTVARSINSFEVARQARAAGLRAVVLKNHFVSTAAVAQLAMQEIGGVEVFGGVVLNRANGGLNVEAVRKMTQVDGHRGKIVCARSS